MPKKRTLKLKQFQGSSASSHRPSAGQDGGDSPTASVNERLSQLRVANDIDAAQRKREIAELVSQRSVPPELRSILHIPESAPPRPKIGVRVRDRAERMRTPGPAAPKSWLGFTPSWQSTLTARGGKRKGKRAAAVVRERNRPEELLRFSRTLGDDFKASGLLHITLKRLAEQWDLLDEDDFPDLVHIPLRLRLRLLSYLGCYGPPIGAVTLVALTQGDDSVTHVDLSGLAGHAPLTLKKIFRLFEGDKRPTATSTPADDVLDSWDAEETLESVLTVRPSSRFTSLTHLSLSHPPPSASWRDLLSVSKHVPQLTHLSLAYWPRPTLTPHLATATIASQHGPEVRAGGSHYYSGIDQDFSEAASLLRQLSGNLLCLQWLDLEGCAEWVPALATLAAAVPLTVTGNGNQSQQPGDDWENAKLSVTTIFTDTWKNLNYINCAQGWLPCTIGMQGRTSSVEPGIVLGISKYLRSDEGRRHHRMPEQDMYLVEKRKAEIWFEQEQKLFTAARRINNIRRTRSCKPITFDFGWVRKAV